MGNYQAKGSLTSLISVKVSTFLSLAVTFQQAGGAAPAESRSWQCALDVSNRHNQHAITASLKRQQWAACQASPFFNPSSHVAPPSPEVARFVRYATSGQDARRWRERARRCEATLFPPPLP